ncbi:MAG: hypothetical protein KVP17_004884 [Porospora cf. gigantea B]|uniref:uncharacterized protein n=1 Tax=Porospora cf. gigantea B TaxID=2853592 RepID=UPI0035719909|nr:MAG: hypothetical protein KVP17_004884 [Porospora cf. gigantea B]
MLQFDALRKQKTPIVAGLTLPRFYVEPTATARSFTRHFIRDAVPLEVPTRPRLQINCGSTAHLHCWQRPVWLAVSSESCRCDRLLTALAERSPSLLLPTTKLPLNSLGPGDVVAAFRPPCDALWKSSEFLAGKSHRQSVDFRYTQTVRSAFPSSLLQEVVEGVMCALCGSRALFVASIFCFILHFALGFHDAVVGLFKSVICFVLLSFVAHVSRKYCMALSTSELNIAYGTISRRINALFFGFALTMLICTSCSVISRLR